MGYSIFPAIGVARLGNSEEEFYLAPDKIGGLPFECDEYGNKIGPVKTFKDNAGQVKRQGQLFQIFDEQGDELTINSTNVESLEWTVHLANKKAAWYEFNELQGNILYKDNSYEVRDTPWRNKKVTGDNRQSLIVDPGPRTLTVDESGSHKRTIAFTEETVPANYPAQFPEKPKIGQTFYGKLVETLGDLVTDDKGRLIVIGAFGHAGGSEELTSYGGADTWHDDISDGPVYCAVKLRDQAEPIILTAWVIVGSPDFAPEIVNISNLSDTMLDVAVRELNLQPELYANGEFQISYQVNYYRDIQPIIERIRGYQWVSNVQSMSAFFSNIFDFKDNSVANKNNRMAYFNYFRQPATSGASPSEQTNQILFSEGNEGSFPTMPLNSGSNSVSNAENNIIDKFLTLSETQHFFLKQWAEGNFAVDDCPNFPGINPKDQAAVGNCVGLPMCPGIEVTWSLQNKAVYEKPYVIKDYKGIKGYDTTGLSPSRDECAAADGCEPGDLTKRMACPWQADFFNCTIQYVNFTDPDVNKLDGTPLPPTYYNYWWPPQSPWDVLSGEVTAEGQAASHLPAGQQMNYARGINSFGQMVEHWSALAFIRNVNSQTTQFPYFVETERNNDLFEFEEVPISTISHNEQDEETTIPVFYIKQDLQKMASTSRGNKLLKALEKRAFKSIPKPDGGMPLPRSGTRQRR
ncbi:MAG: L-lysine 6-oxidase [Paraglaciecola sp.]|jgi:L-lysine 6-oxidase